MLSHSVEGADVGACAQEATGDLLLVLQCDPRDRHGHERGCAPRHEDDKCILRADGVRNIQCCATGSNASRAGNRMIGLQRPERRWHLRRHMRSNDQTLCDHTWPGVDKGLSHRRRSLADCEQERPPGGVDIEAGGSLPSRD